MMESGETQLTAMHFSGGQRRRYLTYKVEYESGSPELLYYSVLPFDGPYHRHNVYELTYVVSGRLTYVMSGTIRRRNKE